MNQRVLDLSRLTNFVAKTLESTEDVKKLLQSQCEEAKFVLAPWPIETIARRELDKESCTCVGIVSSEEHVKEIASGIDRAVAQARRLREKLASNVLEEKKLARRPSVQQIYAPGFKGIGSRTKLAVSKAGKENGWVETVVDKSSADENSGIVMERSETRNRMGQRKQAAVLNGDNSSQKKELETINARDECERDKKSIAETRRSSSNPKKIVESKRITDKKLIGTSPYNSLVAASKVDHKSKGKKNFIAANKSSVKNMRTATLKAAVASFPRNEASKNFIQGSESSAATKSSDSLISRAASAAEFQNLISKISLESKNGVINSATNFVEGNGCAVHDKNAPKFVEEKICTTVDVAEGLDRFGVPSELVKALKVYHRYLNNQSISKSGDKRGEKATHRFLEEFHSMNRTRHKTSSREKLDNLCKDFLPVLRESFNKEIDFIELSKLKIRYTNLDSTYKTLNLRTLSPTKRKISNMIENRCVQNSPEWNRTWKLNAVWNEAYIPSLEGMSRARCIRYSNKNELLTLVDLMQKIQQLKYRSSLVDLLINEIVPSVRNSLEPTSEEYVNAYKMISIISNLLHLNVPVLVRTDK